MKVFIYSVLFFISSFLFAQDFNKEVEEKFEEIFEDNYFQSTMLAVDIFDLTTQETIYKKNEKMLLHPASNMKVITSATALEFLDSNFTFKTSVYHSGIIMDSVCYGDVYVVGGCDPDFTSEDLDTLVKNVKDFGIKEIRGNIYGDVTAMDSLFWGNGWMWDDDPSSDFPYMTPLIINDACIEIAFEPGFIGKPINYSLIPQTDYFDVSNTSITTKEDTSNFKVTRDWLNRGNEIMIEGDISYRRKPDTVQINIVNPEYYFLYLMKENLEKSGVSFYGKIDTGMVPEFSNFIYVKERRFDEVIVNLNKESDNLSAEMTLRALSKVYKKEKASAENGTKMIDSLVNRIGLNYKNYRYVDGSGVSHYNVVTTELMVELLKYFYNTSEEKYTTLKNSFPIAGIDGTLENRMRRTKAYRNVYAKTGTLTGVSTLSGYLTSKNGHELAFSIFVQNFRRGARIARRYQDKICDFLCKLEL